MNKYIDNIMLEICEKLQLPAGLYEQAEARYHTISDIIREDDVFKGKELNMYAHGSFRLKTTVKPLKDTEYDLDFVVEISQDEDMDPQELYNHIYRILRNDGIHNNMLEKKSRCIRIKYANDFHLDIMPGKLLDVTTKEIIVPDKELKAWYHHSNPIKYAEWFENQARTQIINYIRKNRFVMNNVEPIEEQEIARHLEPLRRAVQLIKRYRDIFCDKNSTIAVRSIIICTLMGNITSEYSDTLEIIKDFCKYVNSQIMLSGSTPFEVKNPVVDEILSEKWNEDIQNYKDFILMIKSLTADIDELRNLSLNNEIINKMKDMFGENVTIDAVKNYTKKTISKSRKDGTLVVGSTGVLSTGIGTKVGKNTFYGKDV